MISLILTYAYMKEEENYVDLEMKGFHKRSAYVVGGETSGSFAPWSIEKGQN